MVGDRSVVAFSHGCLSLPLEPPGPWRWSAGWAPVRGTCPLSRTSRAEGANVAVGAVDRQVSGFVGVHAGREASGPRKAYIIGPCVGGRRISAHPPEAVDRLGSAPSLGYKAKFWRSGAQPLRIRRMTDVC